MLMGCLHDMEREGEFQFSKRKDIKSTAMCTSDKIYICASSVHFVLHKVFSLLFCEIVVVGLCNWSGEL